MGGDVKEGKDALAENKTASFWENWHFVFKFWIHLQSLIIIFFFLTAIRQAISKALVAYYQKCKFTVQIVMLALSENVWFDKCENANIN